MGPARRPVDAGVMLGGGEVVSMMVQSHRGAGCLAPDNTMEAFETGWNIGTVPEADVRTTRDGILVAFHDGNLQNVLPDAPPEVRALGVSDLTYEEAAEIDVGRWKGEEFAGYRVPRMSDVFEAMRGRPERLLYVDVKDISLEALAQLAREYDVTVRIILASTKYELLRRWMSIAPEGSTLLWLGEPEPRIRERLAEVRANGFAAITQLQFHVRGGDAGGSDPFRPSSTLIRETAKELKSLGILFQALPIGIGGLDVYLRLIELGVESFASDEPEIALEALRSHAAKR